MKLNVEWKDRTAMLSGVFHATEAHVLETLLKEIGNLYEVGCGEIVIAAQKRSCPVKEILGIDFTMNLDGGYGEPGKNSRRVQRKDYCDHVIEETIEGVTLFPKASSIFYPMVDVKTKTYHLPTGFYQTGEHALVVLEAEHGQYYIATKVYGSSEKLIEERILLIAATYAMAYFSCGDESIEDAFDDVIAELVGKDESLEKVGPICDEFFENDPGALSDQVIKWREWLHTYIEHDSRRTFFQL